MKEVRNQASFEETFGPIKRIGAANNAFRQCRMMGDNYYSPSMAATPAMFGAKLYTTGFHPAKSDGTDIDDWGALAEAVTFARALALLLKGMVITSDTDCPHAKKVALQKAGAVARSEETSLHFVGPARPPEETTLRDFGMSTWRRKRAVGRLGNVSASGRSTAPRFGSDERVEGMLGPTARSLYLGLRREPSRRKKSSALRGLAL